MIRARKGFTLLEAVVTVAVVSVTALFVLRAFSVSLDCMRVSRELTLACYAAEEMMSDIRRQQLTAGHELSGRESRRAQGIIFDCSWTSEISPVTNLTRTDLIVAWSSSRRRHGQSIQLSTINSPEAL